MDRRAFVTCAIVIGLIAGASGLNCGSFNSCAGCVESECTWCASRQECVSSWGAISCSSPVNNATICYDPCLVNSYSCGQCVLGIIENSIIQCGYCMDNGLCLQSNGTTPNITGLCDASSFSKYGGACAVVDLFIIIFSVVGGVVLLTIVIVVLCCCCAAVSCCAAASSASASRKQQVLTTTQQQQYYQPLIGQPPVPTAPVVYS